MKYVGSKNRHAKELLPIILKNRRTKQWYVEPFVGGCNIIDKVTGNRIGNDINYYLIEMWKSIQQGWIPPKTLSEIEYSQIKNNKQKYKPALVAFAGIGCSYSGKWFGGYARGKGNNGELRNYCDESQRNILKQIQKIKSITFLNLNYVDLEIPENSIIYCDPPYNNTTNYGKIKFDHKIFWEWCKEKTLEGHQVFVSEYSAPSNWECVWQKKVNNSLTKKTGSKKGIEKLFIYIGK